MNIARPQMLVLRVRLFCASTREARAGLSTKQHDFVHEHLRLGNPGIASLAKASSEQRQTVASVFAGGFALSCAQVVHAWPQRFW